MSRLTNLLKVRKTHRRGLALGDLSGVGLAFVLIAVILGVGGMILGQMNTKINDSNATAIMNTGTSAISDLSSWLPIIAVVIAAVIIIGLILRGFGGVNKSSSGV